MAHKALIFLAGGFEEVEAVTPIDYLRRAGIEVTTVSIGPGELVQGSHNIPVSADTTLEKLHKQGRAAPEDWDAVVIPGGGKGSENLAASAEAGSFIKAMAGAGKLICAICAAPAVVLSPLGLLKGRNFTCFPGMEKTVTGAFWTEMRVVIDGQLITSRGAGTAGEFAVAIIGKLISKAEGEKIAKAVLLT
ncbi:MAG: DJ-1/PfpI family protein [Treponema sp.]|jgi:4-methyl-5(b-hydroxyethyl)-thiazole monophosphate biosynthesis|nr:DJ-1/PfpI family protein [Treponema sp.]